MSMLHRMWIVGQLDKPLEATRLQGLSTCYADLPDKNGCEKLNSRDPLGMNNSLN